MAAASGMAWLARMHEASALRRGVGGCAVRAGGRRAVRGWAARQREPTGRVHVSAGILIVADRCRMRDRVARLEGIKSGRRYRCQRSAAPTP